MTRCGRFELRGELLSPTLAAQTATTATRAGCRNFGGRQDRTKGNRLQRDAWRGARGDSDQQRTNRVEHSRLAGV